MLDQLHHAIDYVLGRTPRVKALAAAVGEVADSRKELRNSVSQLGQEVWGMVQTGDALAALVHGARSARFEREFGEQEKDG